MVGPNRTRRAALGALLGACGVAGTAAAQTVEAVLYAPRTGTPLSAPVAVPLDSELPANATVTASIPPDGLQPVPPQPPLPPTCGLAPSAAVAGVLEGAKSVALTIGAPSVPCGGGRYTLRVRIAVAEAGKLPVMADRELRLWIRSEPVLEITPAPAQPLAFGVLASPLFDPPWRAGQSAGGVQTLELRNASAAPIKVGGDFAPAGTTPAGPLAALLSAEAVAEGAKPAVRLAPAPAPSAGAAAALPLAPGERRTVQVRAAETAALPAGAHAARLTLTASEAGPPDALSRTTDVALRADVRWPWPWAVAAIAVGWVLGRAIGSLGDAATAEKLRMLDRLRYLATLTTDPTIHTRIRVLTLQLNVVEAVPDDMKAELKAIEKQILDAIRAEAAQARQEMAAAAAGGSVGASVQAASARAAALEEGVVAARLGQGLDPAGRPGWLRRAWGFLLGTPDVEVAAQVWRPVVQAAIVVLGTVAGLQVNYGNLPTFGANGALDLLPLIVWGGTTLAVAKSLEVARLPGRA